MRKKLLLITAGIALAISVKAQHRSCATMENHELMMKADPSLASRMQEVEESTARIISEGGVTTQGTVINIPVVVHVIYNTTAQNISEAQIKSQIKVLNDDFRRLNADKAYTPSAFASVAADVEINFCLATKDPNGAATNGITRTATSVTSFDASNKMKYNSSGGKNAWPAGSYMNIWVCNLGGGLLGYAQFPGGAAATDGVVIGYKYFGTSGTATAPFNKGRTGTHEVGHYLNLRHIWGDASCGNDYVTDTPTQSTSNYSCPSYPKPSCGNSSDMFMNYMDYTDDGCMNMFTVGQKNRMRALFASGGARASLLSSTACGGTTTTTPTTTTTATLTVGTGTGVTTTAPYGTYYMDEKCQFIITKAELVNAGFTTSKNILKSLAFNVNSASSQIMYGFTIKIKHVANTYFSTSSFLSSSGMTTVYSGSPKAVAGWNTHTFSTPFTYNGTDNLLVEICFNNSTYTTDSKVYYTATPAYRALYYKADNSTAGICGATSGTRTYNRPNMKLVLGSATAREAQETLAEVLPVENAISIYPNPSNGNFTVDYAIENEQSEVSVKIFDLTGKTVAAIDLGTQEAGNHSFNFSSSSANSPMVSGMYLVSLVIDGNPVTKRIIVKE